MKKCLQIVSFTVLSVLGVVLLIIGISVVNHQIHLYSEKSLFVPTGTMVEVNDHKLHVYTEGSGNETLVFMSGGGTSSPVLDFKSLYSLLSDDYTIAVIEKAGYGFSEDSSTSRDVATLLYETREALLKAGLQAPYILLPHSMSGIEALYWAQEYPSEIRGIIGLDMTIPQTYDVLPLNRALIHLSAFGSRIGITRFFPSIVTSSAAIQYGSLSEKEKELYKIVFYRRTLTKAMRGEVREIKANAQKVAAGGVPTLPFLFFISNGEGTGVDREIWEQTHTSYREESALQRNIQLDCGHYVHDIAFDKIADESKRFIDEVIYKN